MASEKLITLKNMDILEKNKPSVKWELIESDVYKVLSECGGYPATAALLMGVNVGEMSQLISSSACLKGLIETINLQRVEQARELLFEKAVSGDTRALIFFLQTYGTSEAHSAGLTGDLPGTPSKIEITFVEGGETD